LVVKPVNRSVGVPQCSFLDLPLYVNPNSTLRNVSTCAAGHSFAMLGDDLSSDFFYDSEGMMSNYFQYVTFTPIFTGATFSSITQLALAMNQNANVFAHIRMAVYDNNDTFLMGTNEIAIDNPQDSILYFTLTSPLLLLPYSRYYLAYWADVTLYTVAGEAYNALCYYGLQYSYNDDITVSPWPVNIGSYEADYYNCMPLPVAALGCTTTGTVPEVPPLCPPAEEGVSKGTVVGIVLLVTLLASGLTLLIVWMYLTGRCAMCKRDGGSMSMSDDSVRTTSSKSSKDERYASLME